MAKPVLITGASSGIGKALARVCAAKGHDLVLVARREDRLLGLKAELEPAYGIRALTYSADLTDAAVRQQLFDWTLSQGIAPYALINNAGFGALGAYAETDWEQQNAMLQLNVVALSHLTRLYLPGMVDRGQGRILNVASIAAFLPGSYMAVYYASKAYVLSFTEAIATELEGTGVTATTLCPGPTESEFQDRAGMQEVKMFDPKELPTAAEVAHYGYQAMEAGQRCAVHGSKNKLITLVTRLLPRQKLAEISRNMQKPT